jgi:hypothetical protein
MTRVSSRDSVPKHKPLPVFGQHGEEAHSKNQQETKEGRDDHWPFQLYFTHPPFGLADPDSIEAAHTTVRAALISHERKIGPPF